MTKERICGKELDNFYWWARSARQPNPRGYSPVSGARSVPHSFARSWVAIHFARFPRFLATQFIARPGVIHHARGRAKPSR